MTDLLKAILDWNIWLEHQEIPKEFLWYKRDIDILKYLKFKEIKILQWARRTWKSTLLYQVIDNLLKHWEKNILYLNFDDEVLKQYSLEEIVNRFKEKKEVDYLFLDEIQNCKNWVAYIRKAYDLRYFKQIWITGSNSSLIKKDYSTLLTWRNITLNIFTLKFNEFLRFKDFKIEDIDFLSTEKIIKMRTFFEEYITFWAFPEVVIRKWNKKELLINYFNDFIYKDIVGRYWVNANNVKKLANYLLSNISKMFSYRKLSRILNLNIETIQDYLNYFYETYLFFELQKYDYSVKKQLVNPKKIYSIDLWFVNLLWFNFSENIGRNLENLVFIELKRRWKQVYYHKNKKECDFVIVEWLKPVEVIQVTYSLEDEETRKREIDWILEAMKDYGIKEWLILTYDEEDEIIPGDGLKIKVLPVWKWMIAKDDFTTY